MEICYIILNNLFTIFPFSFLKFFLNFFRQLFEKSSLFRLLSTLSPRAGRGKGWFYVTSLRQTLEERLLTIFSTHYGIERGSDDSALKACCAFHSRDSQYVLSKKAELWAAEHHEYLYLYSVSELDETALEDVCRQTLELGTPLVKPHAQHMYTYLTALVLCDQADKQALGALVKKKHRREFKLSLHGWMEFRIAAVDLSTGEITTNRAGRAFGKDLKRMVERVIANYKGEEKTQ